ncbi:unnamed protein product [Peronospora belbahrii]|uniref:Nucleoporin Nup54 alpha-helical domain-containing protein n=1 Tax=Peronospora belbahrii TaxID=622444 RepID=A0AAU9KL52_9STRA|nr:unnamed protein product [Peronospora belbahrii]CAH0520723.1 unnamed protein product [Peronospora belbahrii]
MFGSTTGATPSAAANGFNFSGGTATTAASSGFNFGITTSATPSVTASTSTAPSTRSTGFSFGSGPVSTASSGGFSFGATPAAVTTATTSNQFNFGGTSTAPSTSGNSGFSFGGTAATPTASSGFNFGGTNAVAPAATSSGFIFGTMATATSTVPTTTSSGFSFGAAAPATNTTPSFGFSATSAAKPALFGQQPSATGTATTGFGGGFGANTGTGFSFSTGNSPSTGTGATGLWNLGGTGFGTATPPGAALSNLGAAPAAPTAPAPIILGADASVAQLNTVKAAYQDPTQSRFKFLMYNTVDPTQRHLYVRPPHISERLWNQAELDNPDPLNCAPVPILGFSDLLKRIKAQQEHAEKYNKYTDDLRAQLNEMDKHTRATEEKLEKCRHEHVQLFHALVKVMRDIELLQNYGKPLQREEIQLAMMLKKLQTLLDSPGQYKARLNDAVSLQRVQKEATPPPTSHLSPQDLQRLYELLNKQRQGLEHLTNIVNDDLADIQLIKDTWRR